MKEFKCFEIKNIKNGKIFIGRTTSEITDELIRIIAKSNEDLKQDYSISGKAGFEIKLLETCSSMEESVMIQRKYIEEAPKELIYNKEIKNVYNEEIITNIINDYCDGIGFKDISKKYNISESKAFDLTRKIPRQYKIAPEVLERLKNAKKNSNKKHRITKEDIESIITDYINGSSLQKIADERNLSLNNVWNIANRNTWKDIQIDAKLEDQLNKFLSDKK
jgi:Mor family transcriptional regulator